MAHYKVLRLILGDQLNASHSWFKEKEPDTLYLIAELKQETNYVKHHVQKLCAFFYAMERFATALQSADYSTLHLTLDDTHQDKTLPVLLTRIAKQYRCSEIHYQYPDEFRLKTQLSKFKKESDLLVKAYDTEHFMLPFERINERFEKTNM